MEDNATDIFVIRDILQECGLNEHVEVARNGQEALSFLERFGNQERQPCPRLVLLDLNLPGIGGIEVLKQIRGGTRCRQCPVIIVTSSESEEDKRAVSDLNADAYFRKPANLTAYLELGKVILRVLESRERLP